MAAPLAAAAASALKNRVAAAARRRAIQAAQNAASGGGGGGWKWAIGAAAALAVVITLVIAQMIATLLMSQSQQQLPEDPSAASNCSPLLDGTSPGLVIDASGLPKLDNVSVTQAQTATAIIASIHSAGGTRKAAVIAIAVAMQESTLGDNAASKTPNGDGDVGPFQQRALPGWYADGATLEENAAIINDAAYAARTFYLGHTVKQQRPGGAGPTGYHIPGLVDVKGWEGMSLTLAAQSVQRSAFGSAYAKWESFANVVYDTYLSAAAPHVTNSGSATDTVAVTGDPSTLCSSGLVGGACSPNPAVSSQLPGVKPDTLLVSLCAKQHFPKFETFYGVRADAMPYHPSGRAVDIMLSGAFPDVLSTPAVAYGQELTNYLQTNAAQLGIDHIIFRQRIWSSARAGEGWRPMDDRGGITANHFDHIHVTTFGNSATLNAAPIDTNGQSTIYPLKKGTYSLGPAWGAIGSWASYHTGQDFAASTGTPTYAVQNGVVVGTVAGTESWCGIHVALTVAGGDTFLYCHLSASAVRVGQNVSIGQQIGAVGETGRAFGPHLHFEHYPAGVSPGDLYKSTDPVKWLNANGANGNSA